MPDALVVRVHHALGFSLLDEKVTDNKHTFTTRLSNMLRLRCTSKPAAFNFIIHTLESTRAPGL